MELSEQEPRERIFDLKVTENELGVIADSLLLLRRNCRADSWGFKFADQALDMIGTFGIVPVLLKD